MNLPFSKEQVKNYMYMYAGVIIFLILFFLLTYNYLDQDKDIPKKVFSTKKVEINKEVKESKEPKKKFKLLNKAY